MFRRDAGALSSFSLGILRQGSTNEYLRSRAPVKAHSEPIKQPDNKEPPQGGRQHLVGVIIPSPNTNPPHPLIIKPPLCYILVLYWGGFILQGLGGFSIMGEGIMWQLEVISDRGCGAELTQVGTREIP